MKFLSKPCFFVLTFSSVMILTLFSHSLFGDTIPNIDPLIIPKFVNQLEKPPVYVPHKKKDGSGREIVTYTVETRKIQQQMLPLGFPKTTIFAYGGKVKPHSDHVSSQDEFELEKRDQKVVFSSPGPTFEAIRDQPIFVQWKNGLHGEHIFPDAPHPMPMARLLAESHIPMVTHLHGGVTPSRSDGHPEAWFTADEKMKGPTFFSSLFNYYNAQEATTLWYHDHTMGMTRLNVEAGLAGFYIIRDPKDRIAHHLPSGKYEIPLMIQDRTFNEDGSLDPTFVGNTIVVNGKVWPNLNVERRQYRFRFVNGSNARFYNFKLSDGNTFTQIGGDGSYLPHAVTLSTFLLAPSERADILIDFSKIEPGKKIILLNEGANPDTVGKVMQFTVLHSKPKQPALLPETLINIPKLESDLPAKLFTLNDFTGPDGHVVLIDGQGFKAPVSELPIVGTTEEWYFQNLTTASHPIHIHLVQFLLEDRQNFDVPAFKKYWEVLNGTILPLEHPTIRLNVEEPVSFLTGPVEEPSPRESGWKDTFIAPPGKVTRVIVRFAPQYSKEEDLIPGVNPFPFDPTEGPGYVWHCHILGHEDNDMMRPMKMIQNPFRRKK